MSKTILEMNHVTKRFPGVIALNDISITLNEGEIWPSAAKTAQENPR